MIVRCKKCKKQYERFDSGGYGTPNLCPKCKKVNINLLMVLALCILLIPLISSQQIFKQNDVADIKIQCIENGTFCSTGAGCNITLNYPNNSILLNNAPMTNQHSFFNYTLSSSQILGSYPCSVTCCSSGLCGTNQDCSFDVTPNGTIVSTVQISIYIFFLIICLLITFFSFRLVQKNEVSKDEVKGKELYEMKKRNEFLFYLNLLKRKLWIIGVFGIYLSILLFSALLDQIVYNIGLNDIDSVLRSFNYVFTYGLIPFTLFWMVYVIISLYKSTEEILRWQFGNIGGMK